MATEEMCPQSEVLREALGKAKQGDQAGTAMLSVREACKQLGISKWTLYELIRNGQLASVKIGSRRLIPLRAITKFIEELEKGGE